MAGKYTNTGGIVETIVTSQSMNASFTTEATQVTLASGYLIEAVITGTPTGQLKLQVSLDGTNWIDYTSSYVNVVAGVPNPIGWEITQSRHNWVRVDYTSTSGTGSVTLRIAK